MTPSQDMAIECMERIHGRSQALREELRQGIEQHVREGYSDHRLMVIDSDGAPVYDLEMRTHEQKTQR